jgi:serine protease inhibitor
MMGPVKNRNSYIKISNSIWIDNRLTIKPDYESVVGDLVKTTNFSSDQAGAEINAWVNQSTLGLIESIVEDGPLVPATLIAINTIYFHALWQDQFYEGGTTTDLFYTDASQSDTVSSVRFMHQASWFPYSDTAIEGHQVIKLGYYRSMLSMVVVLPARTDMDPVSSQKVMEILPGLAKRQPENCLGSAQVQICGLPMLRRWTPRSKSMGLGAYNFDPGGLWLGGRWMSVSLPSYTENSH